MTAPHDVAQAIAAEIRDAGPIPFRRFMELALYDPVSGYYAGGRDPFGKSGDFYTNAQLQPVFGRLLAQQFGRWRTQLDPAGPFTVLELGPGRGETAEEVCRCMPDLDWIPVEFGDELPDRRVSGVVFCNEFFDALPVDVVERAGGAWFERRVGLANGRFVWESVGPCPEPRGLPRLPDGGRIETCDRQVAAVERIGAVLERGWLLAIDYGYTRDEVERGGRFPEGSLMSYARHRADPDVLAEPGRRDITAHVNFSALEDAGRDAGFDVLPLRSQQSFLLEAGKADEFAYALAGRTERRRTALRLQLKSLLFGLGETFRVLVMRRH